VLDCYGVQASAEISAGVKGKHGSESRRNRCISGCHNVASRAFVSTTCELPFEDLYLRGIKYSRAQIYRKVKDGSFPQPVRLGENRIAWLSTEIDAWIEAIAAARNLEAA
jgi:predicted DNA-binding transcriptional regulator AlpA